MKDYLDYYAENHLPEGQSLIETKLVKKIRQVFEQQQARPPNSGDIIMMGGDRGIGKTIGLNHFAKLYGLSPADQLPVVLYHKAAPAIDKHANLRKIAEILSERLYGDFDDSSPFSMADALHISPINLIVIDDAHFLNGHTFTILRYLNKRTGCRIILCGDKSLFNRVRGHADMWEGITAEVRLPKATKQDFIKTVLAGFSYSKWVFNPKLLEDKALADHIWEFTGPSLRKTSALLKKANEIATRKERSITKADIDIARRATPQQPKSKPKQKANGKSGNTDATPGPFEQESALRNQQRNYRVGA